MPAPPLQIHMKTIIANTIVKWFKQLGFAGRLRFKMLYWAYRITGWHIRHREWDFVLDYLPSLAKWQNVSVLDVGCSRSLFCHELIARGYELTGVDLEKPCFKYPGNFEKMDIRENRWLGYKKDFITCISVFEHIEDTYVKEKKENSVLYEKINGQQTAMNNMIDSLRIGGRLLLTIPSHEFSQGHPWHGFNHKDIESMLFRNGKVQTEGRIVEYTERAGQLCIVIEKVLESYKQRDSA